MIFKNAEVEFEVTVVDYEFPSMAVNLMEKDYNYDANWLTVSIKYITQTERRYFKEPIILTYEIKELINELENLRDKKTAFAQSNFMEPELTFKFYSAGIDFKLDLTLLLSMLKKSSTDIALKFDISSDKFCGIISEFKQWISDFPERGRSH